MLPPIYETKITSSYETFARLRYNELLHETTDVTDDGKNHRIRQNKGINLAAAGNLSKGIIQELLGLVSTPTHELFGIIKVWDEQEPDNPKYMVSRLPYEEGETRARIVDFIKEDNSVTLAPSEESKQLYPNDNNWVTTIDLQNNRLGIEHAGQGAVAVLTPRPDMPKDKDMPQLPHELWYPPSREVQARLGERASAGARAA